MAYSLWKYWKLLNRQKKATKTHACKHEILIKKKVTKSLSIFVIQEITDSKIIET